MFFTTDDKGTRVLIEPLAWAEYVRTSPWKPVFYRSLLLVTLALMLSAVAYGLVWIPVRICLRVTGRRRAPPGLRIRMFPLLAVLSILGGGVLLGRWASNPQELGVVSPASVGFYVSTLAFAVLSVLSLIIAVDGIWRGEGRGASLHSAVVSLACVGLTAYLWYWGLIGLRLWAD